MLCASAAEFGNSQGAQWACPFGSQFQRVQNVLLKSSMLSKFELNCVTIFSVTPADLYLVSLGLSRLRK